MLRIFDIDNQTIPQQSYIFLSFAQCYNMISPLQVSIGFRAGLLQHIQVLPSYAPPTVLMHNIRRFNLSRKLMDQSAIAPPSVYHLSKQDELSAFMPLSPSGYNHLTTYVRMLQLRESCDFNLSSLYMDRISIVWFIFVLPPSRCTVCNVPGSAKCRHLCLRRRYEEVRRSCEGPQGGVHPPGIQASTKCSSRSFKFTFTRSLFSDLVSSQ